MDGSLQQYWKLMAVSVPVGFVAGWLLERVYPFKQEWLQYKIVRWGIGFLVCLAIVSLGYTSWEAISCAL